MFYGFRKLQRMRSARFGITMTLIVGSLVTAESAEARDDAAASEASESAVRLVDAVAPDQGRVVGGTRAADGVMLTHSSGHVDVPRDPDQGLELVGPQGSHIAATLPSSESLRPAQGAADGSVVFGSRTAGNVVVVQGLDTGVTRVSTVIPNSSGDHRVHYRFSGAGRPMVLHDGGAMIVPSSYDSGGSVLILQRPWARDANGKPVTTHYEVEGDDLVQVVQSGESAAYPIVADPAWTWYNMGYGAKFNRSETRSLASATAATGMCAILAKRFPAATGACAALGAYLFAQANVANTNRECIFLAIAPFPTVWRYKDGDCR